MSETAAGLRRQIKSAGDLQSVVRTMKTLAASNIGQYERSVEALADYYRTIELGLAACFRQTALVAPETDRGAAHADGIVAVVFGSDQGLVGRFNDVVADFAIKTLAALPGRAAVWAVGERVHARLSGADLELKGLYAVPTSVKAITPLVGQIQIESEESRAEGRKAQHLYVFHNRPQSGSLYEPVSQRLLPLDAAWQAGLVRVPWPTRNLPEVMGGGTTTLRVLIREYLFISLFRACAESGASENASRLAAMQRADKNINELLETLHGTSNRLRQAGIDEELFDVISGWEAAGGSVSSGPGLPRVWTPDLRRGTSDGLASVQGEYDRPTA